MKYICKSRTIYYSAFDTICKHKPCEIELDFEPRGCLCNAVYQIWEEIKMDIPSYVVKIVTTPVSTNKFPKIVCLCGSTRFMDKFFEVGWEETMKRNIVLSVGVCKHANDHGGEALGQEVCDLLDELHLRKIDLADEVIILNVGGYIGDSTRRELEYARSLKKPIRFLEEQNG